MYVSIYIYIYIYIYMYVGNLEQQSYGNRQVKKTNACEVRSRRIPTTVAEDFLVRSVPLFQN